MDGPESPAESARNTVDPAWRLSEVEETVLLEVLVASLRRAKLACIDQGTTKLVHQVPDGRKPYIGSVAHSAIDEPRSLPRDVNDERASSSFNINELNNDVL
ncbi:hypothetical protein JVT61DRAFT_1473 [Boletus reticuloceps]|uniref:Uncharacterized protein n=1 Tax=Boletus reticuloceps TaxID=495285 RepID=A0A8I2YC01_9AGAM|nr:hypothetical protein JVT61DRAFT_1473 [Boletus reticuloceps]